MEREEVVGLAYLGCGMTLERQARVGLRHTATIVDDLYRGTSGIHHEHLDSLGARIDSILHEFLDNRGWALYHLTCRYLIGYAVWQKLNYIHLLRNVASPPALPRREGAGARKAYQLFNHSFFHYKHGHSSSLPTAGSRRLSIFEYVQSGGRGHLLYLPFRSFTTFLYLQLVFLALTSPFEDIILVLRTDILKQGKGREAEFVGRYLRDRIHSAR